MNKNDTRTGVIDLLDVFAKEYGLKFVWSIERRPDGCMTVQFKKDDGQGLTYRITAREIEAANGNSVAIAMNITDMVRHKFGMED